ncbi:MAG: FAD-binding domain-containing protein [Pseudomonadota bacterium]
MVQLVWFKRDLRKQDHEPLHLAAEAGVVLPLFIIEPEYWKLRETSCRHYAFWIESLVGLRSAGVPIVVRVGDAVAVLKELDGQHQIDHLWSHQETGNAWTFERDKRVAGWCRDRGITWTEKPQFGVIRGPVNRNRWAKQWEAFMAKPQYEPPPSPIYAEEKSDLIPSAEDLGLDDEVAEGRQHGGRVEGLKLLNSFFFSTRGRDYRRAMSSPLDGETACSRLSPYFAYGCLSMREAVQDAYALKIERSGVGWPREEISAQSLDSFIARLHWHCHFIQKFESEPEIEFRDLHPAFRGAREDGFNHPHYQAFATGQTGFPFIDACMRSLIATGWINFRMRAMLTAFASYHLWLDWRASGTRLAQLFVDYEPGIHWSQTQMQSGSTAINTPRIYNPVKQSHDQDPDGIFIKRWVPELRNLQGKQLHEPWTMTGAECDAANFKLGVDYPGRIIDHVKAAKAARERVSQIRGTEGFYEEQKAIFIKHGSRKSSRHTPRQGRAWKKPKAADDQLEMDV